MKNATILFTPGLLPACVITEIVVVVVAIIVTPPPIGGRGFVFARFLCFFVSLSATLQENGWTDLHEIFGEGVE